MTNILDTETREIDQLAHRLIVTGYLPPPFRVDPYDGRPVWSFDELALLFDRRPDELVEVLQEHGPVFLQSDKGVPSSWRRFME